MSSDSFYSKWKRALMNRMNDIAADEVPSSKAKGPPSLPRPSAAQSLPIAPRVPSLRINHIAAPPSPRQRPQSGRVRSSSSSEPFVSARPSSARRPVALSSSSNVVPIPQLSLCTILEGCGTMMSKGHFNQAQSEIKFLQNPQAVCCVRHGLLLARMALVLQGPHVAKQWYQYVDTNWTPQGELNALHTAESLSHSRASDGVQDLPNLEAVSDAFQRSCPFVASFFQLKKVVILIRHRNRLDEALASSKKALSMCESCEAKMITDLLLLTSSDQELLKCTAQPLQSTNHASLLCKHPLCQLFGRCHSRLFDVVQQAQRLPIADQVAMLEALRLEFKSCHALGHVLHQSLLFKVEVQLALLLLRSKRYSEAEQLIAEAETSAEVVDDKTGAGFAAMDLLRIQYFVQMERWDAAYAVTNAMEARGVDAEGVLDTRLSIAKELATRSRHNGEGFSLTASPFEVLCIRRDSSRQDVQRAYRRACLRWHPDKWSAGQHASQEVAQFCFRWISERGYQKALSLASE